MPTTCVPQGMPQLIKFAAGWGAPIPLKSRMFFLSRLPFIIFSAPVALYLAAAFAFEPTALAHGALFKNDLAATFAHLLFWFPDAAVRAGSSEHRHITRVRFNQHPGFQIPCL